MKALFTCRLPATIVAGAFFLASAFFTSGAPADFDTTFGTGGKSVIQVGNGNSFILDTALQWDGKILAVGAVALNGSDFALVRYDRDGTIDMSFGNSGTVFTDLGSSNDSAKAVAIQPDGKIIVAGSTIVNNRLDFAVVRYLTDGSLDTSFGTGGKVITSIDAWGDMARTIEVLSDGRLLVGGYSEDGSFDERFAVVRLNPNGSIDGTFGTDGKVTVAVGANSSGIREIITQSDGKFVLVGSGATGNTGTDFILARLNSNGSLDGGFGTSGKVVTSITVTDIANAAVQQPDGKIVVVGYADDANSSSMFAAVRYHANGVKDNDFGLFGVVTAQVGPNFEDAANAVALQHDGRIVLAGATKIGFENYDVAMLRLTPSGGSDQTFGTGGKVIIPVSNKDDSVNDLLIQRNGRILLAGASMDPAQRFSFTLVRLLGRTTTGDFDGDGKTDAAVYRPSTGTWYYKRTSAGFAAQQFGLNGDMPVVADYDGDSRADTAVFRPSQGVWYLLQSSLGFAAQQFGLSGDIPVPGHYDSDGKADIAVFRPSTGVWYLRRSQHGITTVQFGITGDRPIPGDFDRDGRTDLAVFRPSTGVWHMLGSTRGYFATQFGANGDIPVAADVDGDQANDLVVFRPSTGVWYAYRSSDSAATIVQFGQTGDIPQAGDFDGDGTADFAIFRPSNGFWWARKSSDGLDSAFQFGTSGDAPTANGIF